jgi:hypothetical protein
MLSVLGAVTVVLRDVIDSLLNKTLPLVIAGVSAGVTSKLIPDPIVIPDPIIIIIFSLL